MTAEHPNVLIIGVGNEYRHDDAVGLVVAQRLRGLVPVEVSIMESSGEGAALVEAWKGHTTVFLVDAVDAGAPPGTVFRLEARAGTSPNRFFTGSTHAFSIAEAIELGRALNQLPPRLFLYGVQAGDFSDAVGLSVEAEQGVAAVLALLLGDLRRTWRFAEEVEAGPEELEAEP